MNDAEDIATIVTCVGYAKVLCSNQTTVKELTEMCMRTVSILSSPGLYGLQVQNTSRRSPFSRLILCKHLTWAEVKSLYQSTELLLTICLFPTKFEEAARSDRPTLFYLQQQVKELYYQQMDSVNDVEMAFEVGCLDIRSAVASSDPSVKDLLDVVDKIKDLAVFFPPCVRQQYKGKSLKRAVQNYLLKIRHHSEEDCALDMLNRYLILLQFDRDVVKCTLGAGYGIPVELLIGPRYQLSINVENARQSRLLAYFASIRQILVNKSPAPDEAKYQLRLIIEQPVDPNAALEAIILNFTSKESADTVVHLLEGYCNETLTVSFPDAYEETPEHSGDNEKNPVRQKFENFLPNGCPFRLHENTGNDVQGGLDIPRNQIILEQVLGEGQFGDVYKGSYEKYSHADAIPVAVKTCKIDASADERKQFLEEADVLGEFNHPHIIKLFGVCSDEPIWLIMEYAPLGELRHYLLAQQEKIPLSVLITFCYQIVTALSCLEAKRCVHRDIAARNILVAREDWVKLGDFGMARMLNDADEICADKGRKMPIKWMAPESVHHRKFSLASDVWMFGVCMWEILSGGVKPFTEHTNAEAADMVARGQRLKQPAKCPAKLYRVMLDCWNANPKHRPLFSVMKPILRELAAQFRNVSSVGQDLQTQSEQAQFRSVDQAQINRSTLSDIPFPEPGYGADAKRISSVSDALAAHSRWDEVTELEPQNGWSGGHSAVQTPVHVRRMLPSGPSPKPSPTDTSKVWSFPEKQQDRLPFAGHSNVPFRKNLEKPRRSESLSVRGACMPDEPHPKGSYLTALSSLEHHPSIHRRPAGRSMTKTLPNIRLDMSLLNNEALKVARPTSERLLPVPGDPPHKNVTDFGSPAAATPDKSQSEDVSNDPIYLASVQVVKTVRLASQQLPLVPPERYALLVKSIGAAVKDLFSATENEFGPTTSESVIFLAERQLNSSLYRLISTIRNTQLSIQAGPLLEEYRRNLMSLFYAIAADAHSLFTAVQEERQKGSLSDTTTR
ncbi:unnamed protein product [Calicophoron daubneyi]|uniref:non-specific protein-tyrosine kinase n=1 Tax=Calicophoron daubneyi TaxID=300641 RepID=A0AAV2TRW3_CALDB